MSTHQAEEVLKHTFKQLEKMLSEVHRQEARSRPPHGPAEERKNKGKRPADGAEKKKR